MSVVVRVKDFMPKIAAETEAKVLAATKVLAFEMEAEMKLRAPSPSQGPAGGIYSTGFLRAAINAHATDNPTTWQVDSPAEYSIYIEMGTRYMRAFPYVMPTVEVMRPRALAAYAAAVK